MSALDFRHTKNGGLCQVHPKGFVRASYRLAICDYPVLNDLRNPVFVCGPCRKRMEAEWEAARKAA